MLVLQVKVVFFGTGKVKVNTIRSVAAEILSQETITGLILVLQNQVTDRALKAIELFTFKVEIFQVHAYIYLFSFLFFCWDNFKAVTPISFPSCCLVKITDLLVNLTEHVLSLRHRVLNDGEKKALLKQYNIEEKQVHLFISWIF